MICAQCGKKIHGKYAESIYVRWSEGREPRLEEYGLHAKCEAAYQGKESPREHDD